MAARGSSPHAGPDAVLGPSLLGPPPGAHALLASSRPRALAEQTGIYCEVELAAAPAHPPCASSGLARGDIELGGAVENAVVVRVTVNGPGESSEQRVRDEVVPQVSGAPGFQAGYWTRDGDSGLAMVIFDSEENALAAADRIGTSIPDDVTLDGVEVRRVFASA